MVQLARQVIKLVHVSDVILLFNTIYGVQLSQNGPEYHLKRGKILGEHVSRLPAFGNNIGYLVN